MAVATTTTKVLAVERVPTVVVVGEYKGQPTIAVTPDGNTYQGLQAGHGKWQRLFDVDADGDSVLLMVFQQLVEKASPEQRKALHDGVAKFFEQYERLVQE